MGPAFFCKKTKSPGNGNELIFGRSSLTGRFCLYIYIVVDASACRRTERIGGHGHQSAGGAGNIMQLYAYCTSTLQGVSFGRFCVLKGFQKAPRVLLCIHLCT